MDHPVARIQKLEYKVARLEDNEVKATKRFNALLDMIAEAKQEAKEETNE